LHHGLLADAGKALGKAGDGGIDGIIKEDKLGLDLLYIQAKRWDNATVGRPEIQKFVGALHGRRAKKGIFLTTSTFSKEAKDYADGLETKVILIDGPELAELMFDYGVGVSTLNSYVVKRIDSDFFEDEVGCRPQKPHPVPMCLRMREFGATAVIGASASRGPGFTADAALISRYNAPRHAQAAAAFDPQPSHCHAVRCGSRTQSLLALPVSFPLRSGCRKLVSAQATGLLPRA
jgi:hypothetical protein